MTCAHLLRDAERQRRADGRRHRRHLDAVATTATPSCAARGLAAPSGERKVEMHYIGG